MKKINVLLILFLSITFCNLLMAESDSQYLEEVIAKKTESVSLNPIPDSSLIMPFHFIELSTYDKDPQTVSAQIGFQHNEYTASIGIETPASKSGEVQPILNTGLAKSTNIKIAIQRIFWNPKMDPDEFDKIRFQYLKYLYLFLRENLIEDKINVNSMKKVRDFLELTDICTVLGIDNKLKDMIYSPTKEKIILCTITKFKQQILGKLFEKISIIEGEIECNKKSTTLGRLITYRNLDKEFREIADKKCIKWNHTNFIISLVGKIGTTDFNYIQDKSSFQSEDDIKESQKYSYSLKGSLGFVFEDESVLFFTAQYENYFKGGDKYNFVIPFNDNNIAFTKELTVGDPEKKKDWSFGLEYKKIFTKWFGINPGLVYKNKEVFLKLPVYFMQRKEKDEYKGLNGGSFIEWKLFKALSSDNFRIGVFIGAIFK